MNKNLSFVRKGSFTIVLAFAGLMAFAQNPTITITSFSPTSATTGQTVTITGTGFDVPNPVSSVTFGGVAAASFNVVSATSITAVVGTGATGNVVAKKKSTMATKAGFTFITPAAPTITSFTPTSATAGTTVTLTGTNFTGATAVSFGGTAATSFNVVSATSITAVVGTGASGSVSVTTPGGTGTLAGFTFLQTITATQSSNGTISPSGATTVSSGGSQAYSITPNTGYSVATLTVDGSAVAPATSYTFSNVTANHTITATFSINTYTLTYTAGSNGTISGTSPQTVNYGAGGTAVTAVPNSGYYFVQWSDGSTVNPRTDANVTADISVTASFIAQTTPTLAVTNSPVTYNGSAQAAAVSGSVAGTVSNVLYSGSATIPTAAGTYTVTANFAPTDNVHYSSLTNAPAGNFTISQASLAITANNITKCSGATYTFAGTEFTTNGLANGDAVSSVILTSAGAAASATAGVYSITPSAAVGTGLSNYNIAYDLGLLTVETLSLAYTQVNPDCYGDPGSMTSSVTGGTQPYMYEVNSGLNYDPTAIVFGPSTTPLYSPVAPGYYTYSVTDAAGCMAIAARLSVNPLTQTAVLIGSVTAPPTTQICYGATKTITTVPVGGATPYTYSLNTNGVSGPFVASANRYFAVPAGTYYITVKDNVGCTYTSNTISLTQPTAGVSFTTSIGGQACNVLGGITVTAAGGFGGYTYSDNGGSSYQANNMFSGLAYGSYTVAVEDQDGCAATRRWLSSHH